MPTIKVFERGLIMATIMTIQKKNQVKNRIANED